MTGKIADTSKSYDFESQYYDLLFSDLDHDFQFYLDMANAHGAPILECMCGTGRILLHLARNGFEVDGFDLNDNMLNLARRKIAAEPEKTKDKIHIWKDDLRDFTVKRKYHLIIIPFSSFLHILTAEDRKRAMDSVRNALSDDGVFIIDIFNPDLSRPENVLRFEGDRMKQIPDTGETLVRFHSQKFDRENKVQTVRYIYDIVDSQGYVRRKMNSMEISIMQYEDMKALVEDSGFAAVEIFGKHDKSKFTEKSPTMIWVLRKSKI